jgi:hypothetical protein
MRQQPIGTRLTSAIELPGPAESHFDRARFGGLFQLLAHGGSA